MNVYALIAVVIIICTIVEAVRQVLLEVVRKPSEFDAGDLVELDAHVELAPVEVGPPHAEVAPHRPARWAEAFADTDGILRGPYPCPCESGKPFAGCHGLVEHEPGPLASAASSAVRAPAVWITSQPTGGAEVLAASDAPDQRLEVEERPS